MDKCFLCQVSCMSEGEKCELCKYYFCKDCLAGKFHILKVHKIESFLKYWTGSIYCNSCLNIKSKVAKICLERSPLEPSTINMSTFEEKECKITSSPNNAVRYLVSYIKTLMEPFFSPDYHLTSTYLTLNMNL